MPFLQFLFCEQHFRTSHCDCIVAGRMCAHSALVTASLLLASRADVVCAYQPSCESFKCANCICAFYLPVLLYQKSHPLRRRLQLLAIAMACCNACVLVVYAYASRHTHPPTLLRKTLKQRCGCNRTRSCIQAYCMIQVSSGGVMGCPFARARVWQ